MFRTEQDHMRHLGKSDRQPRPGWKKEEKCPYSEGQALFRCGADGTGFVDTMQVWPDSLPPSALKEYQVSVRAKYKADLESKAKWNRSPHVRPPIQSHVIRDHVERLAKEKELAGTQKMMKNRDRMKGAYTSPIKLTRDPRNLRSPSSSPRKKLDMQF